MKLRDYQKTALNTIEERFKAEKEVVLSIAPGGGKTLVAAMLAKQLGLKTLILAHGTSVLRSQWGERLSDYNMSFSYDINSNENIIVNLPQSLYLIKELPKFDLVIVDEAHEFYLANPKDKEKKVTVAGMVQRVVRKAKPNNILLLTGTPSKFIKKGLNPIFIAADTLVHKGYMNDVYFGIATTNENLKETDYRKSTGDVKTNYKFKETNNTLNNLVGAIHKRLTGLNKMSPTVKNFDKLTNKVFKTLDKTMIACNNIAQAEEVYKYFNEKGIKTVLSHSKNDTDSENIELFKNDNTIKVLVVVDRGVLGFDMPNLVNVVDMTASKNIDRIYQLYARVMRKPKDGRQVMKMFLKVVPENAMQNYKFYMQAAICLMRRDIISKYNGKNINAIEMPV